MIDPDSVKMPKAEEIRRGLRTTTPEHFLNMPAKKPDEDFVRAVRILVYEGPRSWVERTLAESAVKGTRHFGSGKIKSAMIGEVPEVIGTGDGLEGWGAKPD